MKPCALAACAAASTDSREALRTSGQGMGVRAALESKHEAEHQSKHESRSCVRCCPSRRDSQSRRILSNALFHTRISSPGVAWLQPVRDVLVHAAAEQPRVLRRQQQSTHTRIKSTNTGCSATAAGPAATTTKHPYKNKEHQYWLQRNSRGSCAGAAAAGPAATTTKHPYKNKEHQYWLQRNSRGSCGDNNKAPIQE
jgi:hypothetical protein